jgi:hypothetical protein
VTRITRPVLAAIDTQAPGAKNDPCADLMSQLAGALQVQLKRQTAEARFGRLRKLKRAFAHGPPGLSPS